MTQEGEGDEKVAAENEKVEKDNGEVERERDKLMKRTRGRQQRGGTPPQCHC